MKLEKQGVLQSEEKYRTYDRWEEQFSCMVREYNHLQERGIHSVMPLGRECPKRLLHIYDYPMELYVKGELPGEGCPTAAIIEVRNYMEYGGQAAGSMRKELVKAGVQIIGDLALGIDGAGHRGALEGKGKVYGVLGCRINICYLRGNYYLYEATPPQGGVISEFRPGEEPLARNFPIRNRIMGGLSGVTLTMEARKKGGPLIAANLGLEQGEKILALPGRVTGTLSAGCNELARSGAGILTSPEDMLEYMGIFHEKECTNHEEDQKGLAKIEKTVYSCLDSESGHPDQITIQTGLSAGRCMGAFLELELEGLAARTSEQSHVKMTT